MMNSDPKKMNVVGKIDENLKNCEAIPILKENFMLDSLLQVHNM